jgi:competence protein ComEA
MSQEGNSFDGINRRQRWWIVIFAVLVVAIIAGGAVLAVKYIGRDQSSEITLTSPTATELEVYLSGAVANEGIYTFAEDNSLADILQTAGGKTEDADLTKVKIRVLYANESPFEQPQEPPQETKININTASAEKLQTLSGIGPVKAQAIIDYRNEEGLFRTVDELLNVKGIGPKTLENIRDKVKVVD